MGQAGQHKAECRHAVHWQGTLPSDIGATAVTIQTNQRVVNP
jgi:hypothetical protein